jgi:hypothetical protein
VYPKTSKRSVVLLLQTKRNSITVSPLPTNGLSQNGNNQIGSSIHKYLVLLLLLLLLLLLQPRKH